MLIIVCEILFSWLACDHIISSCTMDSMDVTTTMPQARQQSRGHFCARPRLECPLYLTWTREIKPMESALSSMGKPHNPMVHLGFIHWNSHFGGTISHEVSPALEQRSNMRNFRKVLPVLPMTSSLMSYIWATHINTIKTRFFCKLYSQKDPKSSHRISRPPSGKCVVGRPSES